MKHGTLSNYANAGCRCSRCKAAARKYHRDRRVPCQDCGKLIYRHPGRTGYCTSCWAIRKTKPLVHGTEVGYSKGCRCVKCRGASNAARSARRKRQRA